MIWADHYTPGHPLFVYWNEDRYAKKPVPRWITRDPIYGRKAFVKQPPSYWQPLPAPPTQGSEPLPDQTGEGE